MLQRHVLRAGVELISESHRPNGLAAGGVVLCGVGVPVEAALDQLPARLRSPDVDRLSRRPEFRFFTFCR